MLGHDRNTLILSSDKNEFPGAVGEKEEYQWLYLGRDYGKLLDLQHKAPKISHFIDIGTLLNETAYELRRPYINYIGGLSVRFNSLPWWISRVAEKNVMVSPVFLYICYLLIVSRLLRGELQAKNVCIISESSSLLETILRLPEAKAFVAVKHYGYRSDLLKAYALGLIRLMLFACCSVTAKTATILTCRSATPDLAGRPLTILRTWVSEKNLGANGNFSDSYFPGLADFLKKKNVDVCILPIIYSVKRNYRAALRWFRQAHARFIIPSDYYHVADYLGAISISIKSLMYFRDKYVFNGLDLSLMFRQEAAAHIFSRLGMDLIMHYYLFKRLKQKGINIERVIITFENMFPEKPIMLGIQKYYPEAKTMGFQHASLFPLLLCSYASVEEAAVMPLPQSIICSGIFFKEALANEGFPGSRLVLGPALRFSYLLESSNAAIRARHTVLVTLPLAKPNALELLSKTWRALKDRKDLVVWLKPHPMMSEADIDSLYSKLSLPQDAYKVVTGKMGEVLSRITLLIGTASATIFDAMAYGVPVIRVRSDIDISLDPMDWFPHEELQFVARTPEEISRQVDRALSLDDHQLLLLKEKGQQIITECFSPVNEKTLSAFIG